MNTALWPATIGHHLQSLLAPVLSRKTIARTRRFFIDHVSGAGRAPAIRIGRQPYGVLPVTAFDRTAWLRPEADHPQADRFLIEVKRILDDMEGRFRKFAAGVAQAGGGDAPQQTLLDILGLHPASVEFHSRYGQSAAQIASLLGIGGLTWSSLAQGPSLQANLQAFLRRLGYVGDALPRIANIFFHATQGVLDGGMVCAEPRKPGFETEHVSYLKWLVEAGGSSVEALRLQKDIPGGVPKALLYILLRHALLLAYSEAAGEAHLRLDGFDEGQLRLLLREEALPHVRRIRPAALASESRWEALYRIEQKISGDEQVSVAEFLAKNIGALHETETLAEQLKALETLISGARPQLERAFAEHIDLCAYRLDAWALAIPRIQLERMNERGGVYLGAYGWLEDVRPAGGGLVRARLGREITALLDPEGRLAPLMVDPANGGLIQAPSLNQAVTGAILRNAYMAADLDAERELIGVNLSSERVRKALQLADGMRQGQRLNALLGYHFERGLHDRFAEAETDQFILDLRLALPLDSGRLNDTRAQPGEAGKVEARRSQRRRWAEARRTDAPHRHPHLSFRSRHSGVAHIRRAAQSDRERRRQSSKICMTPSATSSSPKPCSNPYKAISTASPRRSTPSPKAKRRPSPMWFARRRRAFRSCIASRSISIQTQRQTRYPERRRGRSPSPPSTHGLPLLCRSWRASAARRAGSTRRAGSPILPMSPSMILAWRRSILLMFSKRRS